MAAILSRDAVGADALASLSSQHGDMFKDLQRALAFELEEFPPVPYSLVSSEQRERETAEAADGEAAPPSLVVEDATLHAEFRQLAVLGNQKVAELESFFNRQLAEILTLRTDAIYRVERRTPPESASLRHAELSDVHAYYDRHQLALTQRVARSLALLKMALPRDLEACRPAAKKETRQLNDAARRIMNDWYFAHLSSPYPTEEEKRQMAEDGHITVAQVKSWFANKRNRTCNTKPKQQQKRMHEQLVKARRAQLSASFGKCFLTDYRPEHFYDMCQMLRVLNAVRDYKIGIPLTYHELQQLTLAVLIDRLILRRQYCLAIRICQYLKIPETEGASRVLAHWACYKVQQTSVDDESIARAIAQKLGDTPGVSYSEVANRAIECGRTELAIRLLDFEARAAEQVPLLMKMKRDQLALSKAIDSGDTDLVYTVLLHLKEAMPLGEFLMAIRNLPTAYALFLQYCREQNRSMLRDLFYQEDNQQEEALCRVRDSYEEERMEARLAQLAAAQEAFKKARNEWAAQETDDEVKLIKYQRRLEEELRRPYLNLSLHQTVYQLTLENNHKLAKQLRKEFKIPDRRFWWLKIEACGEAGDWMELDRHCKSQKSPIGYEPFVEVCMKYSNKHEALKYLPKVAPKHKVRCYYKVGQVEEAVEIATQQKSEDDINFLLSKVQQNRPLLDKLQAAKAQLAGKK